MFTWICIGIAAFGCCTIVVIRLAQKAPVMERSTIDEINEAIDRCRYHRECLQAWTQRLVDIHEPTTDVEIDELSDVGLNGADYTEAIKRIWQAKYKKIG